MTDSESLTLYNRIDELHMTIRRMAVHQDGLIVDWKTRARQGKFNFARYTTQWIALERVKRNLKNADRNLENALNSLAEFMSREPKPNE